MKYAIIDTETTGLYIFKDKDGNTVPADAPGQPRVAHFAMILANDNEEEGFIDFYIRPDGWTIDGTKAGEINGLTDAILKEKGVPARYMLAAYNAAIDEGRVVVAFNSQFDTKAMRAELRLAGMPDRFEETPTICVMKASTEVCKIERMRPGGGFKQPKLSEACEFFGIKNEGAHTAGGDTRAAFAVFRKLRELGALPQPDVYHAKNYAPAQAANDPQPAPSMNF